MGLGVLLLGVGSIVAGLFEVGAALPEVGVGAFLVLLSVSLVLGTAGRRAGIASARQAVRPGPARRSAGLSGENAARNPRRTAATAAALTIGVTLVTLIAVLANSIRASVDEQIGAYNADFIVNSNSLQPRERHPRPDVQEEIADLPDVAAASPVRFGLIRLLDEVSQAQPSRARRPASSLGSAATRPPSGPTSSSSGSIRRRSSTSSRRGEHRGIDRRPHRRHLRRAPGEVRRGARPRRR